MKCRIPGYLLLATLVSVQSRSLDKDQYEIGTGIGDITGPASCVNMMGYAKSGQDTDGIHLRLFSRAVVIVDNTGNRVLYITADLQGITQIVKIEVLKALQAKYKQLYTDQQIHRPSSK